MRRLFDDAPGTTLGEIDRAGTYGNLRFRDTIPEDRPHVVINMVATVDGKVVIGGPGTTRLIGSRTDHFLMTRIEGQCDAVLFGATLMREDDPGYPFHDEARQAQRVARGVRPEPLWVGLTTRAIFPRLPRMLEGGPTRTAIFAGSEIAPAVRETLTQVTSLTVADTPEVPLHTMLQQLRREQGVRVLCCLGGPAVNAAMLHAGLVDEVFCTIAPKIHAGRNGTTMFEGVPFPAENLPRLHLVAVHVEDSEIYLRYRVRRDL
jgi:riboflavin biosynthesis pyrimidine reductase